MKKIGITFGIILLVIAIAGMYKFNYLSGKPGYDVDGNKMKVQQYFTFTCSDETVGAFSKTSFKEDDDTEQIASLRLNNSVTTMKYIPSGSGEKYQNVSESLVFWEKEGKAFIEKDSSIIHSDCELKLQDFNDSIRDYLISQSMTLNLLSADSSSVPTVVLSAPDYVKDYSISVGNALDEGTITLDKKHSTVVSKVSANQDMFYFTVPFVQKSSINGSSTYLALFKKSKKGSIKHIDSLLIGKDIEIIRIEDEIQMVSIEFMSDKNPLKERFYVSETAPFLQKESESDNSEKN